MGSEPVDKRVARVRGIRGYSASHIIPERQPRPNLGTEKYPVEKTEDLSNEPSCSRPVRISRAFKKIRQ